MANKYILNNILVSYKLGWNCQAVKNPIPKPNQFLLQNVILKSSVALFTKVFDDFFSPAKELQSIWAKMYSSTTKYY